MKRDYKYWIKIRCVSKEKNQFVSIELEKKEFGKKREKKVFLDIKTKENLIKRKTRKKEAFPRLDTVSVNACVLSDIQVRIRGEKKVILQD